MRIALLTNFIPPYLLPLYRELAKRAELRIFVSTAMERNRPWRPEYGDLQVTVQRTLTIGDRWRHSAGFEEGTFVHLPWDTAPRLIAFGPDAVISGELGLRTLQAAVYRQVFRRSRLLIRATLSEVTERGRGLAREQLRRQLVRLSDAFIVNGASGRRYMEGLGARTGAIFEAPYPVETSRFASGPLERDVSGAYRLFAVGQLIPRKAILQFVRVLSEWARRNAERNIEFWIAGDGPERGAIEAVPRTANLEVRLLGNVDYDELAQVYWQAGALVFPTLADEWGMVVNEALAAGIPVIGSLGSQAVESFVQPRVSGFVFEPGSENGMYVALDQFFAQTEEQLLEMRRAARERGLSISPEEIADRMMDAVRFACAI